MFDPRVLADPERYETAIVRGALEKMRIPEDRRREIEGMLAGIEASIGTKETHIDRLGRNLTVVDLVALNTLADWYRLGCSSFSAWGKMTAGGMMITGRNLDFFTIPGLAERHLIIARLHADADGKRWVSVAWPGLIGAYTAMNEDGVTISMHDAPGRRPSGAGPFLPRSFALRDAIERASGESAVADVTAVLRASPVICGNNVHVSAPYVGQRNPAAVFELDGDTGRDRGVTIRAAADNETAMPREALICTNHYRKRAAPTPCDRYASLEGSLAALARDGLHVDEDVARRLMRAVGRPSTIHTVIFMPNDRSFTVGLATSEQNGAEVPMVRFNLAELLTKRKHDRP